MAKKTFENVVEDVQAEEASASVGQVSDDMYPRTGPRFKGVAEKPAHLSIFDITPDFTQPRRAFPSIVRSLWNGDARTLSEAISRWWGLAQEEKGSAIDLVAVLQRVGDAEQDENMGQIEASLLEVVRLASSILSEGLTNAITVVKAHSGYIIETGERRWLAYHLLYWLTQDTKWEKIPGRVMESFSRWRQATENTARADLNAVGKTRQYAILMMDLWQGERKFKALDAFDTDQAFYAQTLGMRPPRGKGELLLSAMGVANRSSLNDYRRILETPYEVWVKADDEHWSLRQIIDRETFDASNVSDNPNAEVAVKDSPTLSTEKPSLIEKLAVSALKSRKNAQKIAKGANRLGGETKVQLRQLAREQAEWWAKFEQSLDVME
jgi:hypothetical protein